MNIYKLKYTNKATAMKDLLKKGVYVETEQVTEQATEQVLAYGTGIHAVVEIGQIMLTPPVIEDMQVITEATYLDGYHFDVMSEQSISFGKAEIEVNNPKHEFAGHSKVNIEDHIIPR
jgi:hypothetical protein